MKYYKYFFLVATILLLFSCLFLFSCESDVDRTRCRPLTVKFPAYTEEYVYNDENKVETVLYHVPNAGTRTGTFDYNDRGQLIKLTLYDFNSPPLAYNTYELIYNGEKKPQQVVEVLWGDTVVYNFHHDEKQRLVKTSIVGDGYSIVARRYEYDDNDNVIKLFYVYETEEILRKVNTSFDDKQRLYLDTPELETQVVYMFGYEPGKNNVLSATVHEDFPGYPKVTPVDVSYLVDYDEKNLVTSSQPPLNLLVFGSLTFSEVSYACQ